MTSYLVTYTPLAASAAGLRAIERFGHPPFADASCRRTPDFEAKYPSISGVCRGSKFAPRLRVGDIAVYLTKQGLFGHTERHWRFVAVLRVRQQFANHAEAAAWHRSVGLPVPSDCIVEGNPPLPVDHTNGPKSDLEEWDAFYADRVREAAAFVVCDPLWMDLYEPPVVSRALLTKVFGKVPATRTPPAITEIELRALLDGVRAKLDGSFVRRPAASTNVMPSRPAGGTGAVPGAGPGRGCGSGKRSATDRSEGGRKC